MNSTVTQMGSNQLNKNNTQTHLQQNIAMNASISQQSVNHSAHFEADFISKSRHTNSKNSHSNDELQHSALIERSKERGYVSIQKTPNFPMNTLQVSSIVIYI